MHRGAGGAFRVNGHSAHRIDLCALRGRTGRHHMNRGFFAEADQACTFRSKRSLRISFECFETGGGTKVVGDALIFVLPGSRRRIDSHAADRIDRHNRMVKMIVAAPSWTFNSSHVTASYRFPSASRMLWITSFRFSGSIFSTLMLPSRRMVGVCCSLMRSPHFLPSSKS